MAENDSVGPIKEIPIDGKTSVSPSGQLIAVMKPHRPSPKTRRTSERFGRMQLCPSHPFGVFAPR